MKRIVLLFLILVPLVLTACQQSELAKPEISDNIDTTATSDDKADLGNKVWLDKNADGIKQRPEKGFSGLCLIPSAFLSSQTFFPKSALSSEVAVVSILS